MAGSIMRRRAQLLSKFPTLAASMRLSSLRHCGPFLVGVAVPVVLDGVLAFVEVPTPMLVGDSEVGARGKLES